MSEWIKCTERLPAPGVHVLVRGLQGDMHVLYLLEDSSRGWYPGGWGLGWTSHWMPLPKGPE